MKDLNKIANDLYNRVDSVDWDKTEEKVVTAIGNFKSKSLRIIRKLGYPVVALIVAAAVGSVIYVNNTSEKQYDRGPLVNDPQALAFCVGLTIGHKELLIKLDEVQNTNQRAVEIEHLASIAKTLVGGFGTAVKSNLISVDESANLIEQGENAVLQVFKTHDLEKLKIAQAACTSNATFIKEK